MKRIRLGQFKSKSLTSYGAKFCVCLYDPRLKNFINFTPNVAMGTKGFASKYAEQWSTDLLISDDCFVSLLDYLLAQSGLKTPENEIFKTVAHLLKKESALAHFANFSGINDAKDYYA